MEDKRQPTPSLSGDLTPEALLGKTLKYLREARQMSQDALAEAMSASGFSWRQTTVAKTEAGQRPIRVNEVVELARLFNVSVGDLIDRAGGEWEAHARVLRARAEVERTGRLAFTASREAEDREIEHGEAKAALRAAEHELAKMLRTTSADLSSEDA